MSIPDNPFDKDPFQPNDSIRPPRRTLSPPVLNVETDLSPNSSPQNHSPSPANGSTSPSPNNGSVEPTPNRTPGGTLLVPGQPGTKTPRRVQWTSDSHIVSMHPIEPVSPVHTIDENTIDHLHAALERHRTNPSRQRRPPSTLSIASSAGDEDDYDYRLDVDPPTGQPLEQVTSGGSGQGGRRGSDNLQQLLDHGVGDHVPTFIPLGETDGLPNIQQTESQDELSEAKNLVRAHTGKWGLLRRRVKGAGAVNRAFASGVARPGQDPEKATRSDQEAFASRYPEGDEDDGMHHRGMPGLSAAGIPGGASVLSSLLALYGQQLPGSEATSAASSRAPSEAGSSDGEEERSRRRVIDTPLANPASWDGRDHGISTPGVFDTPAPEDGPIGRRISVAVPAADLETPQQLQHVDVHEHKAEAPPQSPGIKSFFKKAKDDIRDRDRPKAARSGAGVFGALIQNTGNLSGAATPAASTLAPAAKRPGYQLSRYSLPDAAAPEPIRNWRPDGQSRPHSRSHSRPNSRPGSIHSSTAVGDSPKDDTMMKKNVSSDDILNTRSSSAQDLVQMNKRKSKNLNMNLGKLPGTALKESGMALRTAEKWVMSGGKTPLRTPPEKGMDGYFSRPMTEDERRRAEWEKEKKRRRKAKEAKKKQEIFIIQHVAAVLARQQFLMKLARALMMFGSPSHRLETQIQATAKVLEINAQVVYLPGTMLISFGDDATHTSETKFLKQATGLDLGKLLATHNLYWSVVHDKISVDTASKDLDVLMTTPVYYNWWQTLLIGALCSAFITVIGFYGSFIDALMSMPLGMCLVGIQMLAARNDMFSNVFEIAIATLVSFIAAALASTQVFCYTALVSGGVVLILPGYIVLTGALELASRNIIAGSVRIGYSVIYSLFLGFGISIGAEFYRKITGLAVVGANNYTCDQTHRFGVPWYQQTPSGYWWFLCAPAYSFFLSLRNQQPLFAKELPIMVVIACAGWASNHFSSIPFPNRSDMTSAIGSFVVGVLGNLYGRFTNGSSFPVTVTGILFQLPSGLANGGIFNFAAADQSSNTTSVSATEAYSEGFGVAEQLISVAIGLTVGLFTSAVITHPFGGGRKRGSGIFSF